LCEGQSSIFEIFNGKDVHVGDILVAALSADISEMILHFEVAAARCGREGVDGPKRCGQVPRL